MIKLTNLLMTVAIAICVVNFNVWVLLAGRFLWGLSIGAFTVFVPKFITETSPTELKGPLGGVSQIMCCVGILVPSLLSLVIPASKVDASNFMWNDYWRVCWGISVVIGLL